MVRNCFHTLEPGSDKNPIVGNGFDVWINAWPFCPGVGIVFLMTHQERIALNTSGHRDMHDITGSVTDIVTRSGIRTGIAHVFNVGSSAVVGIRG